MSSTYVGFKPKGAIRVYSPLRDLNYCCRLIVSNAFKQVEKRVSGRDEKAMEALENLALAAAKFFNGAKSASAGSVADVTRDFLADVADVAEADGGRMVAELFGAVVTGMLARYASGIRESTDVNEEKEPEVIRFLEQTSILSALPVDAAKGVEVALRGHNLWSDIGDREGQFVEVVGEVPDETALERMIANLKKEAEKAGVSVEELLKK